ncbi:MAG: hypothetical protein A2Z20_08695 [Bdellovibrionales bacterium RBG_16_40_8]|nr:MAG: hypothetical protein A2Z20_08695 [Bdellovibrionales bacterium RBG_16_40_8]
MPEPRSSIVKLNVADFFSSSVVTLPLRVADMCAIYLVLFFNVQSARAPVIRSFAKVDLLQIIFVAAASRIIALLSQNITQIS